MKKSTSLVVVLALAIGVGIAVFLALVYFKGPAAKKEKPAPVVEKHPVPPPAVSPSVPYPLPKPKPQAEKQAAAPAKKEPTVLEKPLPGINDSDNALKEALEQLFPGEKYGAFLIFDHFIQRFVLMVDNLTHRSLPVDRLPTRPAPGQFKALGEEGHQVINPKNYRRYTPFVHFVDALNTKDLVAVYVHFYPLFQKAYRQLGYPTGYFNDRLIEVIDHLLATPEIHRPIRLVQHVLHYKFADPALESLSAGQKIMIRMGSDNSAKIKKKLREIRRELIARALKN
jgi:hypothetical protein